MTKAPTGRKRGFTLIELLVTLAIVALALGLAAPSFVQFQRNSRLTAVTNTLLAAINTAKAEAMKTGSSALVVPLEKPEWASGWVVFVDSDYDGQYTPGDSLVLQQETLASYLEVKGNSTARGSDPYIRFNGSGYSVSKRGGPVALSLGIKRNDTTDSRTIVVARSGRTRACNPATSRNCPSVH